MRLRMVRAISTPFHESLSRTMAGADVKEFTVLGLKMWQQVVLGLVLGVITGLVMGAEAAQFKFLGTIFINLIKMVVVPLIFLSLVAGITSMGDSSNFKRVGN